MKNVLLTGLFITILMTLTACSNTNQKTYYQLPVSTVTGSEKRNIAENKQIYLVDINVADFLNGLGIVYQVNDVQYIMANNNLWASSLHAQLQRELINSLNNQLSNWLIISQMLNHNMHQLMVNVYGFHGRYDGKAIIQGEWIFTYNNHVIKRQFDIELPQTEDGYDALVRTLAKGWQQLSIDIANVIYQIR